MTDSVTGTIALGKIVRSDSHVRYACQVYGPGEVATPPEPADYAFGSFVRVPLRLTPGRAAELDPDAITALPVLPVPSALPDAAASPRMPARREGGHTTAAPSACAVGLIYDTLLLNPAFGTLGPRLSSDEQNALFSPDYLAERAVLVAILLLGTLTALPSGDLRAVHGVPPLAPDLGAEVSALPEADVRAFHHFADGGAPGGVRPYLHMGYLPHAIAQDHPLLPVAMLRTIERLERLFPENRALLSIVKGNFAWRLKVQTAG
ncbi:MAG: hypothetical protein ACHQ4H_00375 [Ktedonobacterales bacterium]